MADPDCPRPEELLGYEMQRGQVEENTRLMLSGRAANNVLLFGDGGTGKSATVKSMLYCPAWRTCASSRSRRRIWWVCPA